MRSVGPWSSKLVTPKLFEHCPNRLIGKNLAFRFNVSFYLILSNRAKQFRCLNSGACPMSIGRSVWEIEHMKHLRTLMRTGIKIANQSQDAGQGTHRGNLNVNIHDAVIERRRNVPRVVIY
jgi:hypothetical protein